MSIIIKIMHTLLFKYDPVTDCSCEDVQVKFKSIIYAWAKQRCDVKLADIFGHDDDIQISSPIVSQNNMVFEINLTKQDCQQKDGDWILTSISSEDLAIAMGLDPLEWTVWRKSV